MSSSRPDSTDRLRIRPSGRELVLLALCSGLPRVIGAIWLPNPFYVPKLVSAVAGAGVCLLVFLLTLELTGNRRLSLASFALVACNPYHVLYSSSAMTDVPHICAILLCAYCCIKNRWFLAACFDSDLSTPPTR